MAAPATVSVIGMRALMRDVAKMADDTSGPLLTALKAAARTAAEPVASRAREAVPHVSNDLSGDIRVTSARTGAAIRMGRKAVPYAGWIEFGGTRHEPHESTRTFTPDGRYLFPAAVQLRETSAEAYAVAMQRVFNMPGIWTNTTDDPELVHD